MAESDRNPLPANWIWGVGQSAYQTEGGINVPGGPRNNWYPWEAAGLADPAGIACDFWRQPEAILDRAAAIGLNAIRISVEWARVEPADGLIDTAALDRYVEIVAAAQERGLDVHVCCWHFTHPLWLGSSPWLRDPVGTIARFAEHVARVTHHLGTGLVARGLTPPRYWLTLNELNVAPLGAHLMGSLPPGGRGDLGSALGEYDALGCAHVAGYDVIHRVYERQGWPTPMVSTNNSAIGVYELDLMLLDVLTGRTDLAARAESFDRAVARAPRHQPGPASAAWERTARRIMATQREQGLLRFTAAALRSTGRETCLDWVAADWYTPFLTELFRPPGRRGGAGGARTWAPQHLLWEQRPNPAGVRWYLGLCGDYGLPVVLVENGLCSPGWAPRPDGWDRGRFLRENISAVLAARDDGVPMAGYLHWSITDNYEWGSYLPRFGLYACDRTADTVTIAETDAMGERSAETYAAIIAEHARD